MSFWSDQRVLVTGGTGFIGSHVVRLLGASGARDVIVARSKDYDLTHEAEADRLLGETRPTVVLHLAGLVGGILANKERPADFFYQNLMMGTLMLHASWKHGVSRFVAAGAGCGYPEHAPMPLRESSFWDGLPQRESAPYSLAKRLLQIQSQAYFEQHGFVSVIGIPGNVYGPNDNFDLYQSHVIPALVRKFVEAVEEGKPEVVVWGSGRPSRDFVYVEDVARGLLRAAEVFDRSELVNLSDGRETTIREVVETLAELTGFGGTVRWDASRPDGQLRRLFDMTKAKQAMGFETRVGLREGLKLTVDWFRTHRHALVGGRAR
jgi:GDP-L-fucose synthase